MELSSVRIDKPEDLNFILGQSHFIKTVEDLHETLVQSVPGIRFGIAFCESSGPRLVRRSGNDPGLVDLAVRNAEATGAGQGRAILGVVDGGSPLGVETDDDEADRKELLRRFGYKL